MQLVAEPSVIAERRHADAATRGSTSRRRVFEEIGAKINSARLFADRANPARDEARIEELGC